jgi:type I restriction enzyme S subunit
MKNELSLPSNWQMKTLGDLFEITSSKRVFKEDWKSEGVPFYRAREIVKLAENGFVNNELFISEKMFKEYSKKYGLPKPNDIMVTGVGTLGICYVVKQDDRFYFKDGNIIWLKSNGKANSRYVEYAFKSDFLRKQIDDSVGATVGTYTIIKAKSTKIPLPPLPEQQRIVSILDKCFAAIDKAKANAEQNLKNAKELFESYLQGVFEKKGDGWEEKKLGDVLVKTETVDPTKNPDTEFTYLDVSSVNKETKEIETSTVLLGKDAPSRAKKMIKTGDVIFATVRPTHSRVALIPEEFDEQVCSTGYFVLRSKGTVNNKLIFYFLLTKGFNEQMEKLQKGASYPAVTDNDVKGVLFHFPKSKEEQQTIVRQLDALRAKTQKLEAVYQQKIADLEELKKSILQKAFAGELKVSALGLDGLQDDRIIEKSTNKILKSSNPKNHNADKKEKV